MSSSEASQAPVAESAQRALRVDESADGAVAVRHAGQILCNLRTFPETIATSTAQPTAALIAAVESIAAASPAATRLIRHAAASGDTLQVIFPSEVLLGLRTGTLRLMETSSGQVATAVDGAGKFVAHGRVVGGAGAGLAAGAGAGLTAGAAVVLLPLAIAGTAAYAQQRRLEKALRSIQTVVDRIEVRIIDAEDGVNDAAEQFLQTAAAAIDEGGLTDQLRIELALHRQAVESLFSAHRRRISRLKASIEAEQDTVERETGKRQPWVDAVVDAVKDGRFDDEVIRFLRSLVCRTKLNALTAITLAEQGRPRTALELVASTERELRAEFFDLYNRLVPLARIEPDLGLTKRLPGLRSGLQRAQTTVRSLVGHIDTEVLPLIPEPDERDLVVSIDARNLTA